MDDTYERALNLLSARARSARDLRTRLLRKGEPEAEVTAAIERLVANGLLDDAAYARQVARAKGAGGKMSKGRVRQELYRLGVARDVADAAITEVWAEESIDASDAIEHLARKKLATMAGLDPPTQRRRLYAYLARRGYDTREIERGIKAVAAT
jgi:regulatory protein